MHRPEMRFTIAGFGVARFHPADFSTAIDDCHGKCREDIANEIIRDGFDLESVNAFREHDITRMEMVAIWAECHGYGL